MLKRSDRSIPNLLKRHSYARILSSQSIRPNPPSHNLACAKLRHPKSSPQPHRLLLLVRVRIAVGLLISPPPSTPHIPSTGTAARQTQVNRKPDDAEGRPDPHERKHVGPEASADMQPRLRRNDVAEDHEHDGRDDGRDGRQESSDERPDRHGEAPPSRVKHDGGDEDGDGIHAYPRQEEAEHEVAGDLDEVEDAVDVGRQGDCGAGQ